MSFSPLIRVSIVSGEDSAVLIRLLLSRVSSIIASALLCPTDRRRACADEKVASNGTPVSLSGQKSGSDKVGWAWAEERSRCDGTLRVSKSPRERKQGAGQRERPPIQHRIRSNPMSLGVLNNLNAVYAENSLNSTNNSLQGILQQLSSGSRINSGADDAAGLSLVNGLAANSAALTQSATNATEGVGLLQVADGALSQVTNLLNRVITLATEASNGTLNTAQEAAANQEYQSILAEINNIGSTTTYNQNQVFTGNQAGTAIYTGDSSSAGSTIDNLFFAKLTSASVGDSGGTVQQSNAGTFVDLSKDAAGPVLATAAQQSDAIGGTGIKFTI